MFAINTEINNGLTSGRNTLGCVIVFASGNNNSNVSYPANSNPDVIAVGAMSPCGQRKRSSSNIWEVNAGVSTDPQGVSCDNEKWWGSNYGNELDIVAPGVFVPTTDIQGSAGYNTASGTGGNYHQTFNGTSSATPHVAGVAALILSVNPGLTQDQVRDIIESTSTKVGSYSYSTVAGRTNGTWNSEVGYGCVNALAAIQSIYPSISGPTTVCSSGATFTINHPPDGVTITWAVSENLQIINRQDTIQVTVNRISGGNATITSTITTSCGIIELTRTFNPFVSLSKEYDYLNCNDNIFTATASSGASIIWETTNGLLINGMLSPQSGIGNTVTISSPYGTAGEVNARNCYEYSTIDFSPCVEWSANLRFINSSSPGNPMQGEPLQAEADPAPWDGSNYRWYIDGQFIAHTNEPIFYTYDWLCGDHQLQVQAVTPDGLTDLWQNGIDYWGLCGYYMSLLPNPASDYVEVSITAESSATNQANRDNRLNNIFTVRVYNVYGFQVYSSQKAGNKFNIPISNLKEGVYVVEVSDGKKVTRKQLIVKRS